MRVRIYNTGLIYFGEDKDGCGIGMDAICTWPRDISKLHGYSKQLDVDGEAIIRAAIEVALRIHEEKHR